MLISCEVCGETISIISDLHYKSIIPLVCSKPCLRVYIEDRDYPALDTSSFYKIEKGANHVLKSSFENVFKTFLDECNFQYQYEPFAIKTGSKLYIPDFFIPSKNLLIEIKGQWKYPQSANFFRVYNKLKDNLMLINSETFERIF